MSLEILAGDRGPAREAMHTSRIADNIRSNDLSSTEARALERRQRRVDRMQRNAASDGKISAREQARIRKEQERADRKAAEQQPAQ